MLQNAYLLAKIGADTAENERNFAEKLTKIGNYPTGPLPVRERFTCSPLTASRTTVISQRFVFSPRDALEMPPEKPNERKLGF